MRTAPAATVLLAALVTAAPAVVAGERNLDAVLGRALFDRAWVPAPASTRSADGLGPLFNARSCSACHGLRGLSPASTNPFALTLKLGDDPLYGQQIQTFAALGLDGEGRVSVEDGPRGREARLVDAPQGPLDAATTRSLRHAPTISGIGLLALITETDILAGADPDDRDGDGVSGRPNLLGERRRLGRFGWKAAHASLAEQNATAFALDLGLGTPIHPASWADCTDRQPGCRSAPQGGSADAPEITPEMARLVDLFVSLIPAPRPAADPEGLALFEATGCAACHRPTWQVVRTGAVVPSTIAPFTDMLLHDMGEPLADDLVEGDAAGGEWRTPPLWGIAARLEVGLPAFLHDGRASTLEAAIGWHAGEAASAVHRFDALAEPERQRLLAFLSGL
ncbi:MAG TPA: di-heme oxidoredictase family protein [Geminicoccaceae bacterium]|nr:di-heme oxidoredictase family protein [Geminicoccus sp.]HMU48880.1 di-heme oxidoredictase family protein [Geminicoccaceae bacterium]